MSILDSSRLGKITTGIFQKKNSFFQQNWPLPRKTLSQLVVDRRSKVHTSPFTNGLGDKKTVERDSAEVFSPDNFCFKSTKTISLAMPLRAIGIGP